MRGLDLRPGEARPALGSFVLLVLLMFGHVMLETARDALFLGKLPASHLALGYALVAVLALVLSSINARFVRRLGEGRALFSSLLFASLGTMALYVQRPTRTLVFVVYVWSAVLGTLLLIQFWMLLAQVFTPSQGKRIYGGIAAGGVAGAIAGTGGAAAALAFVPVQSLLVGSSVAFLLAAAVSMSVRGAVAPEAPGAEEPPPPAPPTPMRRDPYVGWLAALTALSTAATLAIDYVFKADVAARIPTDELGPYFARSYALFNAVALVVQLVVSGPLVRGVGVTRAIMVMPLLVLGGGIAVLASGAHGAVFLMKGVDGALRHSLHRHAGELLSQHIPAASRARAKPVLDGALPRATQAFMGGAIFLLAAVGLGSPRVLAAVIAGLALLWLGATLGVRGPHLELFRRVMAEGSQGAHGPEFPREWTGEAVSALSSRHPTRVIAAIDLLFEGGRADLVPADVLRHGSVTVQKHALDWMARTQRRAWASPAEAILLTGATDDLRATAARALAAVGALDAVSKGLADPSPAVRAHAAIALTREEHAGDALTAPLVRELLALVGEDRRTARLGLLAALANGADHRFSNLVLALVDPGDLEVMGLARRAMASLHDPRFIPLLVARLHVRADRNIVRDALVALGAPAQEQIERALTDPDTPSAVRFHLPRTLSRFHNQRAADFLVAQLAVEEEGPVRYKVLRGLGALVARGPLRVDRPAILAFARGSLVEYLELLARQVALERDPGTLDSRSGPLVIGLLRDKLRQANERAFRLLQVAYREEDLHGAHQALLSPDRLVRSNAVEFLDALARDGDRGLARELRELLELVADDLLPEEKVERARPWLANAPTNWEDALVLLLHDRDSAVFALAVVLADERGGEGVREAAKAVRRTRPARAVFAGDGF